MKINERKLPEGHHRIDMTVDLHTAVIVMLFAVSIMCLKLCLPLPPPLFLFFGRFHTFFSHLEIFNLDHINLLIKCYKNI